jgi:acyl-CoA thioester hydrolase
VDKARATAGKSAGQAARRTCVRVRYADTDQMGVAYYANYLVWFEVARTEWLRDGGWSYRDMEADGIALPVIEAHCEYRQPARYDDEIEIRTMATLLTPVRIRFDYEAWKVGDTLSATGHTIHAALGPDGRPRRLPSRVLQILI